MENNKRFRYGWRRDLPDFRDKIYQWDSKITLPKSVNLQSCCSQVFDQLSLGSCTSNAGVAALEYLEIKHGIKNFIPLSRLFVYFNSRLLDGNVNSDSGATIRNTIKSMRRFGAASETSCPYNIKRFKNKPSVNAYINGQYHQITEYFKLSTLTDMKACLASGYPFLFGFSVFESFESPEVAKSGIVDLPTSSEEYYGGHAVLAVGYDDTTKRFLVRNSWGKSWGQQGYFTMPYAYLTNPDLAASFWTIRAAERL